MTAEVPVMATELASLSPEHKVPVGNDGGFFIGSQLPLEILDEYPENQRQFLATPQDELTGVPCLPHPDSVSKGYARPDDNHHPEHPRLHIRLDDEAGRSVRHSRVIRMNHWVHHNSWHSTFRGPVLPITQREKFERVVYNTALLIPELAIDLRGPGDFVLRPLSPEARVYFWKSKAVHVERSGIVKDFLRDCLFNQSLETASDKEAKSLLGARNPVERWQRAKRILGAAAIEATRDMSETFKDYYDRDLLPRSGTWRVSKVLMSSLGNRDGEKATTSKTLQSLFKAKIEGVQKVA